MVPLLLFYLVTINALGFLIMLADKEKAKKRLWRIPEATLLTVAALGGSIGCLAGMKVFHHKTRKPKFYIGIPVILALQLILGVIVFLSIQQQQISPPPNGSGENVHYFAVCFFFLDTLLQACITSARAMTP